jgi:ABC-type nitrate/sulfonate/bicarbonate transport system substrate-binding protein
VRGKRIGVAGRKGTDQLVAEEMYQAKVSTSVRFKRSPSAAAGADEARSVRWNGVGPPHDLMLRKMGYNALLGPPEMGLPSAGMLTSDRLIKENPQVVRRTLKALLRAHQYILENRQDTIQSLIKWLPQALDIAEHSYDGELKTLNRDGTMTDAEINSIIERVGEKKRPLDEVRDFSFARDAMKELGLR